MMFQDGTRAYINSDSRLKYPKKFALSSREVYLEGEAYFVVSKIPTDLSLSILTGLPCMFWELRSMFRLIRRIRISRSVWTKVVLI